MNKANAKTYIVLVVVILLLLSATKVISEKWRGIAAEWISPMWVTIEQSLHKIQSANDNTSEILENDAFKKLQLDNQLLRSDIEKFQTLFQQERLLNRKLSTLLKHKSSAHASISERRFDERLLQLLSIKAQAVPARVIFRSPATWSSSLWVNVGTSDNERLGQSVIMKNSPVVVGLSLVGVIDYVGKNQSRVRLITDSGLCPSVRASRGGILQDHLLDSIRDLQDNIAVYGHYFAAKDDKNTFIKQLENLKELFSKNRESWSLAKGELYGGSKPLWRSVDNILYGIGFNYDFDDEEGSARDLRTGKLLNASEQAPSMSILKVNDLLVTTGMDGVFPPGLHVGRVSKVYLLNEGDYYYELEAHPTAGNLNELSFVFVLPPVGYNPNDQ